MHLVSEEKGSEGHPRNGRSAADHESDEQCAFDTWGDDTAAGAGSSTHPHPLNTPCDTQPLTHAINTPHPLNTPCDTQPLTHATNTPTPSQHTLRRILSIHFLTHVINTPSHHILSYTLTTQPLTYPLTIHYLTTHFSITTHFCYHGNQLSLSLTTITITITHGR